MHHIMVRQKCSWPNTFQNVFCKTEIDPERITKVTPKPNLSVVTAKETFNMDREVNLQIDLTSIREVSKRRNISVCPT